MRSPTSHEEVDIPIPVAICPVVLKYGVFEYAEESEVESPTTDRTMLAPVSMVGKRL